MVYKTTSYTIVKDTRARNVVKTEIPRIESEKWLPQKHDLLFIIMLSTFAADPPAGAIYSVTN